MRNTRGIRGRIDLGRVFILLGLLFIIAIVIVVSGCYDSNLPGLAAYNVKVSGLDGLNGTGGFLPGEIILVTSTWMA